MYGETFGTRVIRFHYYDHFDCCAHVTDISGAKNSCHTLNQTFTTAAKQGAAQFDFFPQLWVAHRERALKCPHAFGESSSSNAVPTALDRSAW